MKERIVQLSEYDYQKLYDKANLNEEKIKELVEEYYKNEVSLVLISLRI